jgi:hypothetical protein
MQLGKSLVGALVGGAVGIAALIGIHMLTGWDKAWLAILVALITGVGVRWAVNTSGHASYARGALTALVAILAFLAWYPIQAQLTVRGALAKPILPNRAAATDAEPANTVEADETAESADADGNDDAADSTETAAADTEAADPAADAAVQPADEAPNVVPGGLARPRAQQFSTWDFVWLCVAGLIAYELGRGTAAPVATGAIGSPDDGPPPSSAG